MLTPEELLSLINPGSQRWLWCLNMKEYLGWGDGSVSWGTWSVSMSSYPQFLPKMPGWTLASVTKPSPEEQRQVNPESLMDSQARDPFQGNEIDGDGVRQCLALASP